MGCMPTRSVGTIKSIREQARSHGQCVRSAKMPASTLALFPAKAGPTKKHTADTLWDRLQPGSC
jgi:hypothetical protein